MYLILSAPADRSARWMLEGLMSRGLQPIEHVTSEQLAFGRRWEHRIGRSAATLRVDLEDGRTVQHSLVRGVLNRLISAPLQLVSLGRVPDREYATMELNAFYLSWLHGVPGRVIGRARPGGLCGQWRHISEWAAMAQRAGLHAPAYRQSSHQDSSVSSFSLAPSGAEAETVIALHGKLFGPPKPARVASACLRLAAMAGGDLLGLSLFRDRRGARQGRWSFAGATPYPDLDAGGAPLLDHVRTFFLQQGRS